MLRVIVVVAQLLVGSLFIFSGLTKGIDPTGTAIKIGDYAVAFGMPVASDFAMALALILNLFEATLGFMVLVGMIPRVSKLLLLVIMIPMTLLTLYVALFNPVADCGCFGDALKISNGATFGKNVVLLSLAFMLHRHEELWWRLLPPEYEVFAALVSGGVVFLFNLYPLRHLPAIDFRSYKVGASLYELTVGGAKEGVYDYQYIYERDGVEKSFSMDELGDVDSTWTFVRDETVELTPPVMAPGADFILTYESGASPMPELIDTTSGYHLLYFLADLEQMEEPQLRLGLELQQATQEPVWLVMSSTWSTLDTPPYDELTRQYSARLFLDRSTALTAVRTQPGLMVVHDGVILRKLSGRDLMALIQGGETEKILSPVSKQELNERRKTAFAPIIIWSTALLMLGYGLKRQRKKHT